MENEWEKNSNFGVQKRIEGKLRVGGSFAMNKTNKTYNGKVKCFFLRLFIRVAVTRYTHRSTEWKLFRFAYNGYFNGVFSSLSTKWKWRQLFRENKKQLNDKFGARDSSSSLHRSLIAKLVYLLANTANFDGYPTSASSIFANCFFLFWNNYPKLPDK